MIPAAGGDSHTLIGDLKKLQQIFNSLDEGICLCEMIVDSAGRGVDYRFLEVNPLFSQMTGLVDPVGKTALELVPNLEMTWVEQYARVGLGRESIKFEQQSQALGRWYEVFSLPIGPMGQFAVIFKDQTRRHEIQQALQESETRFREMADQLPLLVWHVTSTGKQVWVNAAFRDFFGTHGVNESLEDITSGLPIWQHILRLTSSSDYAHCVDSAIRQAQTRSSEIQARRADGALRWLESWVRPLVGSTGESLGHLGTSLDITERRAAQEAQEAAVAAQSQRIQALRIRQAHAEILTQVLSSLEKDGDLPEQLQQLTQALVPSLADFAVVEIEDGAEIHWAGKHRLNEKEAELRSITAAVGLARRSPHQAGSLFPQGYTRSVTVDLGIGVHGVLLIGRLDGLRGDFSNSEREFLDEVSRRAGVVLAAARNWRAKHTIAVRLQRALLPDDLVWDARMPIAARYESASALMQVGGDWYDSFKWPTGEIGLMVGDVVGHNLDSAAAMGRLRAAMAALAVQLPPDPGQLLQRLRTFALSSNGTNYATAVALVVDPSSGKLYYSSAGHPPAIVISPTRGVIRLDAGQTPPLGIESTIEQASFAVSLDPGSLVIAYTDGLVERRGQPMAQGLERLEKTALELFTLPIDKIADRLLSVLVADKVAEDDVVVACFTYNPPRSTFRRTLTARAAALADLRAQLRSWCAEAGIVLNTERDLLLAVGEACANSVAHAYFQQPAGLINVDVNVHLHYLSATITDYGTWRTPGAHSGLGGRGTKIIQDLSQHYDRTIRDGGTTIAITLAM